MGRALSLRIPVLFNLRCLMKLTQKKIYYILQDIHRCQGKQGQIFLPLLVPYTGSEKSVSPDILTRKMRQRKCFSRTSLLTIAYITIILKKEPWEGGKGGSRFRFSLRVGSVNGYVITEQILKNLRATISQGKDKNFSE